MDRANNDEILQLAEQGNLQALSVYLNRHLIPNGAHVKVKHKEDALQVLVVVMRPSGNQELLASTQQLLTHLRPAHIQSVKIYTQVLGSKQISLQKQFVLPNPTPPSSEPVSIRSNPSVQGRPTVLPKPSKPIQSGVPLNFQSLNPADESVSPARSVSSQRTKPNLQNKPSNPEGPGNQRYSVAEFLSQATNIQELSVLHKHPFFTGVCPTCAYAFAEINPPPVYWDCPKCGWRDDLSKVIPQSRHQNSPQTSLTESKRLGDYLIEAGLLNVSQIEVALADQLNTGLRFGEVLIRRGWIKEETIEYLMQKIILPERSRLHQNDTSYLESSRNLLKALFQDRQPNPSIANLSVPDLFSAQVQQTPPPDVLAEPQPSEDQPRTPQKPRVFGKLPNERETLILPDVEVDELNEYLNGSGRP